MSATVVDHITPHRGDMALFWRPGNHQSLCKACHDRKTVLEDGGLGQGFSWHPAFLRPSLLPLTVVCGPPCAGKSRFVRRHASGCDVVVDLDEIIASMPGASLTEVGRERNRRLLTLSDPIAVSGAAVVGQAWLVVDEPASEWRQWWVDQVGARRVVVIEADAAECRMRALASRAGAQAVCEAVDRWWGRYTRRDGDELVPG